LRRLADHYELNDGRAATVDAASRKADAEESGGVWLSGNALVKCLLLIVPGSQTRICARHEVL